MPGIGPGQGARSEGVDHCSVLIKLVRQQSPGAVQQQQQRKQQRRRQQQGIDVDPSAAGDGASGAGADATGVDRSMGLAGGGRVDQVSDEEGEVYDVLVGHNTWDDYQVTSNTHYQYILSIPYQYTISIHPINIIPPLSIVSHPTNPIITHY